MSPRVLTFAISSYPGRHDHGHFARRLRVQPHRVLCSRREAIFVDLYRRLRKYQRASHLRPDGSRQGQQQRTRPGSRKRLPRVAFGAVSALKRRRERLPERDRMLPSRPELDLPPLPEHTEMHPSSYGSTQNVTRNAYPSNPSRPDATTLVAQRNNIIEHLQGALLPRIASR